MLPSHYADPAGNQVAISDADALIALIRTEAITGQTWVLTDEHEDWVTLDSLAEWPQWRAAAAAPPVSLAAPEVTAQPDFAPQPEFVPPAFEAVRWPVKAGWALLALTLLAHFGLFYYTRGQITGVDVVEELGALAFAAFIASRIGQFIQNRVNSSRAGQKPPVFGLVLLTMSAGLMLTVAGLGASTWKTYQEEGAAGLAFQDSLRGVDETIQGWATQMNDEYNAIYDKLDQDVERLDVKGLEESPASVFASLQATRDGAKRASEAAGSYAVAADKMRSSVPVWEGRLKQLKLKGDLMAKQQKAFDEEFAPNYYAEAEFLAARGEALAAMADLFVLAGDLTERGEFQFVNGQVEIRSEVAGAEYDRRIDRWIEQQEKADRLYEIVVKLDAE